MSILDIANDGLPNILVVLYATVLQKRTPPTEADLLEQIAPSSIVHKGGEKARQTLNRWVELGMFVRETDGNDQRIRLANQPEKKPADERELFAAVRCATRTCVLDDRNNENFWDKEDFRSADCTRALAWLLAQNVYRTSFQTKEIETLERAQIANTNHRIFQNENRIVGLGYYWAPFLGFTRKADGNDIDPTIAIRDILSQCLKPNSGMPATDFVQRLAEILPVLDGGRWRREVEREMNADALPHVALGQLSTSLSRALLALRFAGDITLEQRADLGSSIVLTGQSGLQPNYRFHWIARPTLQGVR